MKDHINISICLSRRLIITDHHILQDIARENKEIMKQVIFETVKSQQPCYY